MAKFEKMFGISLGEASLYLIKPVMILVVCKIVVVIVLKLLDGILEKSKLDSGIKGFLRQIVRIGLYILGIIMAAQSVNIDTASLVTILGVVSLAFSLSLQNILTNVFSGIMLLITKPFVVGDFVEISGIMGTVTEVTLMRTKVNTPDNKAELIPNSDVASNRISNFSNETRRRVDIEVSAEYSATTEKVKEAILSAIDKDGRIIKEENCLPVVRLLRFNANDISYTVKVWCENAEYWDVYYDLMENIREAFIEYGIAFSYPHRIVHIKEEKLM